VMDEEDRSGGKKGAEFADAWLMVQDGLCRMSD
jgi:hypothetical protein